MLRSVIHYGLHLVIPLFIAIFFFPKQWKKTYIIFLASMIVDIDHLFASPIFDPNRCSVGFHPLHSYSAIAAYITLLIPPKTRVFGFALLWHIITDQIDCWMM
ncbi:DUF6122 family protein [Aquimarina gracilis]|uniref:DUF6122 family protein n=1 Tax=Aquimarina gracilis TaxID=874422 RepID=A0ABU5ZYS6_9FLAO|nr:DUF6122 family protein [Aquimarina gracilis]MEB3347065.1 DUF6122 family protein [Aquimarina gracilis]